MAAGDIANQAQHDRMVNSGLVLMRNRDRSHDKSEELKSPNFDANRNLGDSSIILKIRRHVPDTSGARHFAMTTQFSPNSARSLTSCSIAPKDRAQVITTSDTSQL
jgi:hypothetical protein